MNFKGLLKSGIILFSSFKVDLWRGGGRREAIRAFLPFWDARALRARPQHSPLSTLQACIDII